MFLVTPATPDAVASNLLNERLERRVEEGVMQAFQFPPRSIVDDPCGGGVNDYLTPDGDATTPRQRSNSSGPLDRTVPSARGSHLNRATDTSPKGYILLKDCVSSPVRPDLKAGEQPIQTVISIRLGTVTCYYLTSKKIVSFSH